MHKLLTDLKIGIIGLGYVGLPLAVEFGKKYSVVGFDINQQRVAELNAGKDKTLEVSDEELVDLNCLSFSCHKEDIADCNVYVITVPTPIDESNTPDLAPLRKASELVGEFIKKGDVVIYESTVYPGATEEVCLPIVEAVSGLKLNKDFFAGYSPERINPGDKVNTLTKIIKITSGSSLEAGKFVDRLYRSIISAGTHFAGSIKVAEAAKVIENTQRDMNIAIVNEFAKIFSRLKIDTEEVLNAASTKWNFLKFKPGLVGGHCISVDPYYLTHKAQSIGYHPEMILAARRLNDGMPSYVASRLVKAMLVKKIHVEDSRVLVMGFSFKENCTDLRNTKVADIIEELSDYNINIDIFDPWCCPTEVKKEYGLSLIEEIQSDTYDAILVCVGHDKFQNMGAKQIKKFGRDKHVLFDLKYILDKQETDIRL